MVRCAGRLFVYVAILFFTGLPEAHAQAENRVALVIGNGAYATSPLRNPVNDAQDMAAALRGVGFEVIHRENASRSEMRAERSAISARKSGKAGWAFSILPATAFRSRAGIT